MTTPEPIGAGTLKLIVLDARRDLVAVAKAALHAHVRPQDIRRAGASALIVYCTAAPSDVRDWLAPLLAEDESALVTEFERWSARGAAIDRRWMLRRGH
ncbi:MAG: hypothetical protein WEB52_13485 [Dehalococcoidia bacterium]